MTAGDLSRNEGSGHHHHDGCGCGSAGSGEHVPPADLDQARSLQQNTDLYAYIDIARVTALNDGGTASRALVPYRERNPTGDYVCQTVADPQLIMYVPFSVTVKVTHIAVAGPSNETAYWPATMRAYVNRENLDFTSIEQIQCSQSWSLANTRHQDVEALYATRPSKFQNVQSITLFFPENMSGDEACTRIEHVGFYGTATGYRRAPVVAVYEARPLATDSRSRVEVNQKPHVGM
ncbi:PITH domain-containing protein 1 [Cyanidiococcus yangmingshanensis]|uniref:PITH domain-containing protein 1 n=1 Tax=Cyanidiococcus yangmingshanensis TaxID=2690220 RepID=A0A7J7IJM8_9RHOD|nr:PITH domain-containing protein 1 [Cyanidiococcus yangmingshanensis]